MVWVGVTRLNCVCDFLHIERVRLMCFSFFVLWVGAFIALAGNLTARISILRFSFNGLVLVAGIRVAALVWWFFIALKL